MGHVDVYAYIYECGRQKLLVLTNSYPGPMEIDVPEEFLNGKVLILGYSQGGVKSWLGSHSTLGSRPDLSSAPGSDPTPEPGPAGDVKPTLTLCLYEALAVLIHTDTLGE